MPHGNLAFFFQKDLLTSEVSSATIKRMEVCVIVSISKLGFVHFFCTKSTRKSYGCCKTMCKVGVFCGTNRKNKNVIKASYSEAVGVNDWIFSDSFS